MTHLFYLFTAIFLFKEAIWITSPYERLKEARTFHRLSELNKGKRWDEYTLDYKSLIKSKWPIAVSILVWLFVGLLTVQWPVFLAVIVFNFFIIAPISKLTQFGFFYMVTHWVSSVVGFAFGIFIVLNHYHLHIDTLSYFKQLFQI